VVYSACYLSPGRGILLSIRAAFVIALLFSCGSSIVPAGAAGVSPGINRVGASPAFVAPPPGLRLAVAPRIVDVGGAVTFTVSAKSWAPATSVSLSFTSPHHGFLGHMVWGGSCGCFELAVSLSRRIHPLETARAIITVHIHGATFSRSSSFMIRGLAPNGRDFAPGGRTYLSTWVSQPDVAPADTQHFCVWAHTLDNLGVPGLPVRFVVHYPGKAQQWSAGRTARSGVVCSSKVVPSLPAGQLVRVDVHVNSLSAGTSFTVQSQG
jgi:hypothetical protein